MNIIIKLLFEVEPCLIPATNESGECVALSDCVGLSEEFKRDRTHVPMICNKELRKVCCPLKFMPSDDSQPVEQNTPKITTESTAENELDVLEPFIASQIIKSKLNF